ncbi:hypothetical protein ABEY61_25785 [Bacillus toyonensis]
MPLVTWMFTYAINQLSKPETWRVPVGERNANPSGYFNGGYGGGWTTGG